MARTNTRSIKGGSTVHFDDQSWSHLPPVSVSSSKYPPPIAQTVKPHATLHGGEGQPQPMPVLSTADTVDDWPRDPYANLGAAQSKIGQRWTWNPAGDDGEQDLSDEDGDDEEDDGEVAEIQSVASRRSQRFFPVQASGGQGHNIYVPPPPAQHTESESQFGPQYGHTRPSIPSERSAPATDFGASRGHGPSGRTYPQQRKANPMAGCPWPQELREGADAWLSNASGGLGAMQSAGSKMGLSIETTSDAEARRHLQSDSYQIETNLRQQITELSDAWVDMVSKWNKSKDLSATRKSTIDHLRGKLERQRDQEKEDLKSRLTSCLQKTDSTVSLDLDDILTQKSKRSKAFSFDGGYDATSMIPPFDPFENTVTVV